jgi:hypothetical protein
VRAGEARASRGTGACYQKRFLIALIQLVALRRVLVGATCAMSRMLLLCALYF